MEISSELKKLDFESARKFEPVETEVWSKPLKQISLSLYGLGGEKVASMVNRIILDQILVTVKQKAMT